jgi:acyl-CoA reductase-like NAD-dependent aldehyde dehydrogenase
MALSAVKAVKAGDDGRAYSLYIDGKWTPAADGAMADDFNPATGARVAQAGRADALRAVEAAYRARESWGRLIVSERAAILLRAADVLASKVDEIREVLIEESGSTFGKSMFESVLLHRPAAQRCGRRASHLWRNPATQRAGADWHDTTVSDEPHIPFGGIKNSGFGRDGGNYSMEEMTELKWITIQLGQRQFPF